MLTPLKNRQVKRTRFWIDKKEEKAETQKEIQPPQIMTAKCPKCEKYISEMTVKTMPAKAGPKTAYSGAVFCCPICDAILGAGIDPVLLTNQILAELRNR